MPRDCSLISLTFRESLGFRKIPVFAALFVGTEAAMEAAAPATGMDPGEVRSDSSVEDGSRGPGSAGRGFVKKADSFFRAANQVDSMAFHGQEKLPLRVTLQLAFQTIGVVYGDLGTSPLYVYDSAFTGGGVPTKTEVLGALSLIIYTLSLVPLLKYVFIVLKANDRGNGGTFALYSLICRIAGVKVATNSIPEDRKMSSYNLLTAKNPANLERAEWIKEKLRKSKFWQQVLLTVALFGTCAVIGDGVLTPAISVLSAMSGIKTNFSSVSQSTVTYSSAAILVGLFCLQRFGTDRVSFIFSPFVFIWLVSIFLIGAYNIRYYPAVLKAFNPYYMYLYFRNQGKQGWISLGGIVLALTGTEAMFADLGHFSVTSIQIAFSTLVYPALLVAYTGQAAYIIHDPSVIGATFYKTIPHPVFWPMFIIATFAAIIASQAMITATFSIVEQSMALGCFPRCKVVHTSKRIAGQIYIPEINWILMVLTVAITLGFKSTIQIGNAFGVAVVSVMLVTTGFLTLVMIMVWQKSLWVAGLFCVVFMTVEGVYYSATLYKVPQGGWVSLAFVVVFFTMMYIWHYGRTSRYNYEVQHKLSLDWVLGLGSTLGMTRVPGIGLVYTELAQGVPNIFAHLTTNLPAVHSILVFVCIKYLPVPYVHEEERLLIRRVGPRHYRMYRIAVRYGYHELKDRDKNFEKTLIDALASYICDEGSEQSSTDTDVKVEIIDSSLELASQSSTDSSVEVVPRTPNATSNPTQEVEEEIALLEQSRLAGVVYLLGRTEVKAREDSSLFRKFIIDHAYDFLRRNCRGNTVGLSIPPTRRVQIGMLHYI